MLSVVCVNTNNYLGRGDEYVTKLQAGVARNLNRKFSFHVLTKSEGEGWWSKISLFEPGRFEGRCIFFDLDTVIVGSLDHLSNYRGAFAGLSDFFHPEFFASGVMLWQAGQADHVYTQWVAAGRPQSHPRGDGGWIGTLMPQAERLQTLFPGQIVSFKAHCGNGIPEGSRVVAFHGLPRPHHLNDLMNHW